MLSISDFFFFQFRRLNFDLSSNTTSSSSTGTSRILFDKPPLSHLLPTYHPLENCSNEKPDDYIDVESHHHYENDSLHVKRTPSLSSTTSISTCSPTTTHHRSNPIISPIYPHYSDQSRKRSRSPCTNDEESNKRLCSTTNQTRPVVKNDLRNIESLIERVPEKPTISTEPISTPSTGIDPNYLYLFYMAQFHNHQKPSLLHPHALQRYFLYNQQQQFQNYYPYSSSSSSLTNTK